jgi:hypothetical protein
LYNSYSHARGRWFETTRAELPLIGRFLPAPVAAKVPEVILTEHHVNVTLSHPHALRTVVGVVLFMTVTGVLCTALGTIIRSTVGAIATFAGLLFVLPGIVDILPSEIGNCRAGLRIGHCGGPVSTALQLDYEPVAHRYDDVGEAVIERPFVVAWLIGPERHDDPPANLDRLFDPSGETALRRDTRAVLAAGTASAHATWVQAAQ